MSRPLLVFLDANVLFSAALGGPAFELILALATEKTIVLTTTHACLVEAETNLERKRPDALPAFADVLELVSIESGADGDQTEWAAALVHADDVHVLAAARALGADVLVTGDITHFGDLMHRDDLGIRIRTPRAFVLEGPMRS